MSSTSPSRIRDKQKVFVKCKMCGNTIMISYATYHRHGGDAFNWRCKKCIMNNLSDEEKIKRSKKIKDTLNSKSLEEKRMMTEKRFKTITPELKNLMKLKKQEKWRNKSSDDRIRISKRASINTKRIWDNMGQAERDYRKERRTAGFLNWWYNELTDEDREEISKHLSDKSNEFWNKSSDDYKKAHGQKSKDWYNSLSDSEKEIYNSKRGEGLLKYWSMVPYDIRFERIKPALEGFKIWLNSLSPRERIDHYSKIISSSNINNKFTRKFEKFFSESILSSKYILKKEIPMYNNGILHYWDYGIYDNDNLKILIDLDGELFHADKYDYDAYYSKKEYDEYRGLTVPKNIMHLIIPEKIFDESFSYLIDISSMNYDQYVDFIFNKIRSQPFPVQYYTNRELIYSWKLLVKIEANHKYYSSLSKNIRYGDMIIYHFHHSIWNDKIKNCMSPYDAWKDDNILIELIKLGIIYQTPLNRNKISQGFCVSNIAKQVPVFSAGRAKIIINRYLTEFDTIFDPFSGYSGRMLGALSLGKRYIGQDISLAHTNESNKMLEFLRKYCGVGEDSSVECHDIYQSSGEYQCLFTSPPYQDEIYQDVPVSTNTCDDWIDECLKRFKCRRYVFVVDKTEKYKDSVVDNIRINCRSSVYYEYLIIIDNIGGNKDNAREI